MKCSTNGGCRICPGIWVAGAVLLFMLVQNLLLERLAPHWTSSTPSAAQEVHEPAEGSR